jgi:hypothetical protein
VNALVPLYDALMNGTAPAAPPNAMFDLRDYVERLGDREWPGKRAALVSREASGDDPMTAMLKAFEALGALSGQDMSPVTDLLQSVAGEASEGARDRQERELAANEPAGTPPSAFAVARRALILLHEIEHMLKSVPADAAESYRAGWPGDSKARFAPAMASRCEARLAQLEVDGLAADLSSSERRFLGTPLPDLPRMLVVQFSWRAESLHCVLWALGLVGELNPWDQQAGPESVDFSHLENPQAFISSASLRPTKEIATMRDRAELWNWRARTRRLAEEGRPFPAMRERGVTSWDGVVRRTASEIVRRGEPVPLVEEDLAAFGKAFRDLTSEEYEMMCSIAQERHFALNWLCGQAPGNRWDATPTGT